MMARRREAGYAMVDVIMGLVLFGLVIVAVYQVFLPAFALSRSGNDRLAAQQDIRLAVDRVARQLHETTLAVGRIRVYPPAAGCTAGYEGCIGFVSARRGDCTGPFQLRGGAPDWQATIYIWRDTAANELRWRCDRSSGFPAAHWPPPSLAPYTVIGRQVAAASFALEPAGSENPMAVEIALREQPPAGARRPVALRSELFRSTVFAPENR